MEFQTQLYTLRKRQGLSQEELANIIGVSRQAVQKWESGAARPDLDNLTALAQFFEISLDELVGYVPVISDKPKVISYAHGGYYSEQSSQITYWVPCRWHYEYKSKQKFLGLPVVHIHFADRGPARATGLIAIGNTAAGGLAIGGASCGLISLGGFSIGLLGIGGLVCGGVAWGGIAIGIVAVGGCAVGAIAAFGGLAVGNVAIGGCAVGDVAMGSTVVGQAAFPLIENTSPSSELWLQFCQAVQDRGFGYQILATILRWIHLV